MSLLIGRDLLKAHHVIDQIRGTSSKPYAQRLTLGLVMIGEACLDVMHSPTFIDVMKTIICSHTEETSVGGFFLHCEQKTFQSIKKTNQYSNAQLRQSTIAISRRTSFPKDS